MMTKQPVKEASDRINDRKHKPEHTFLKKLCNKFIKSFPMHDEKDTQLWALDLATADGFVDNRLLKAIREYRDHQTKHDTLDADVKVGNVSRGNSNN